MKTSLVFLLGISLFSSTALSVEITPAQLIDNVSSERRVTTSRAGLEGWTVSSYVIGLDGKPSDIVVVDYSGRDMYLEKAINYIDEHRYEPAKIDGEPVLSHKKMLVFHTISSPTYRDGTVSRGFAKEYAQALESLTQSDDLARSRALIDALLEDHTKSLEEQAMASWVEAIYHYNAGDFLEYLRQLTINVALEKYLPREIVSRASANLFQAQVYSGYYMEARQTLTLLGVLDGVSLSPAIASQMHNQLEQTIDAQDAVVVNGKLNSLGKWLHHNFVDEFKISDINGEITSVEVRCTNYHHTFTEGWQQGIIVPQDAYDCITLVHGRSETVFTLGEG